MRVLLTTIGSAGDVNPFIAVGRALVQRGHIVSILVNPHFQTRVEEAGMTCVPLGDEDEFLEVLHHPDLMHPLRGHLMVWRLVLSAAQLTIDLLRDYLPTNRPDVILRHHLHTGVNWIARKHDIPTAVAALAPAIWMSAHERGTSPNAIIAAGQRLACRGAIALASPLAAVLIERPMHAIRRHNGFPRPRPRPLRDEWHHGDVNLGLWSPTFRGPMPDDPGSSIVCGFPFFDQRHDGTDPDHQLDDFLDAGPPPVVFSLGTTAVHSPGDYYDVAAEACRRAGVRGVLLTGHTEFAAGRADILAVPYAPFSTLLPRAAMTVQHGGIGSTGQALRAGRPMIVTPVSFDQPDNAARVKRLGVAAVVPRRRLTADRLAQAIRSMLRPQPIERARLIGERIRAEDGAGRAATAVEELGDCRRRPSAVQCAAAPRAQEHAPDEASSRDHAASH